MKKILSYLVVGLPLLLLIAGMIIGEPPPKPEPKQAYEQDARMRYVNPPAGAVNEVPLATRAKKWATGVYRSFNGLWNPTHPNFRVAVLHGGTTLWVVAIIFFFILTRFVKGLLKILLMLAAVLMAIAVSASFLDHLFNTEIFLFLQNLIYKKL